MNKIIWNTVTNSITHIINICKFCQATQFAEYRTYHDEIQLVTQRQLKQIYTTLYLIQLILILITHINILIR
jgi:hypothetical protein